MLSIPYEMNRNYSLFVLDFSEGRSDSPFRVRSVRLDIITCIFSSPEPKAHKVSLLYPRYTKYIELYSYTPVYEVYRGYMYIVFVFRNNVCVFVSKLFVSSKIS